MAHLNESFNLIDLDGTSSNVSASPPPLIPPPKNVPANSGFASPIGTSGNRDNANNPFDAAYKRCLYFDDPFEISTSDKIKSTKPQPNCLPSDQLVALEDDNGTEKMPDSSNGCIKAGATSLTNNKFRLFNNLSPFPGANDSYEELLSIKPPWASSDLNDTQDSMVTQETDNSAKKYLEVKPTSAIKPSVIERFNRLKQSVKSKEPENATKSFLTVPTAGYSTPANKKVQNDKNIDQLMDKLKNLVTDCTDTNKRKEAETILDTIKESIGTKSSPSASKVSDNSLNVPQEPQLVVKRQGTFNIDEPHNKDLPDVSQNDESVCDADKSLVETQNNELTDIIGQIGQLLGKDASFDMMELKPDQSPTENLNLPVNKNSNSRYTILIMKTPKPEKTPNKRIGGRYSMSEQRKPLGNTPRLNASRLDLRKALDSCNVTPIRPKSTNLRNVIDKTPATSGRFSFLRKGDGTKPIAQIDPNNLKQKLKLKTAGQPTRAVGPMKATQPMSRALPDIKIDLAPKENKVTPRKNISRISKLVPSPLQYRNRSNSASTPADQRGSLKLNNTRKPTVVVRKSINKENNSFN